MNSEVKAVQRDRLIHAAELLVYTNINPKLRYYRAILDGVWICEVFLLARPDA